MLEKLYPLDLPPGLKNNGTTYQSRDRWFTGSLVRFFQGKKQPVGGWVQRTTTGATIAGIPNAALSWKLNSGTSYLAIGTSTNLYVVDSSNVVYDITPTSVNGDAPYRWQLENFGSYLVAVPQTVVSTGFGVVNLYTWAGVTATPAQPVAVPPFNVYGIVVTPERFLVAFRGGDPTGSSIPPARIN